MLVEEIANDRVISIGPEEYVTQALSRMQKYRIHQLLVDDNHMLILKNVIRKGFDNNTKVKNLMTSIPVIDSNEKVENAAKLLIDSGLRALPVTKNGKTIGILSESDFMKIVKNQEKNAIDLATTCFCTNVNSTVAKVRALMERHNISKVPILDKGKVIGIIDTLGVAKVFLSKSKSSAKGKITKGGYKEFLKLLDVPVKSFMRKPIVVKPDTSIERVAKILEKKEEVLITNGYIGIITPKDLLELFVTNPKKGIYVQITNIGNESNLTKIKIDDAIREFVMKVGTIIRADYLFLHVEKHEKYGSRKIKYSVRTRFPTNIGFFVSRAWGYSLITAVQEALSNLKREVMKKREKVKEHSKR